MKLVRFAAQCACSLWLFLGTLTQASDLIVEIRGESIWLTNPGTTSLNIQGLALDSSTSQLVPPEARLYPYSPTPIISSFPFAQSPVRSSSQIQLLTQSRGFDIPPGESIQTTVRYRGRPETLRATQMALAGSSSATVVASPSPLNVSVDSTGVWLQNAGTEQVVATGIAFKSSGSFLGMSTSPVGESAAPFSEVVSASPSEVVFASLGTQIAFAPQTRIQTNVRYESFGPGHFDLSAELRQFGKNTRLDIVDERLQPGMLGAEVRGDQIWLVNHSATATEAAGIRLNSAGGHLIPVDTAGVGAALPFDKIRTNTRTQIELWKEGGRIEFGPGTQVQTQVGYGFTGPVAGDLTADWLLREDLRYTLPVLNKRATTSLAAEVRPGGQIWLANYGSKTVASRGVSFTSILENLAPIPLLDGALDASPFDSVSLNTPKNVVIESQIGGSINLGPGTEIATSVGYRDGRIAVGDLKATNLSDGTSLSILDRRQTSNSPNVLYDVRDRKIWMIIGGNRVDLVGLDLNSRDGLLVPSQPTVVPGFPSPLTLATPFVWLLSNNTHHATLVAETGKSIAFAPGTQLETSIGYVGDPFSDDLTAQIGIRSNTVPVSIQGPSLLNDLRDLKSSVADGQVWVENDGLSSARFSSISLSSQRGLLEPVAVDPAGRPLNPLFDLVHVNQPTEIKLSSIGSALELASGSAIQTSIGYRGHDVVGDLNVAVGRFGLAPVDIEIVPEPYNYWLPLAILVFPVRHQSVRRRTLR